MSLYQNIKELPSKETEEQKEDKKRNKLYDYLYYILNK